MSFVTYDCRNCGAGIDVQPDNLLTICEYCGSIHPAKDIGDVPVHIVPSRPKADIVAAVQARMAQDRQMKGVKFEVTSAEGVYVPIYINHVHLQGAWEGYKKEKKNKKTVKVWKGDNIDQAGDFPVPARKHAHEFGLAQLGQVLFESTPVPFRDIEWKSMALPVLSVDMDEGEADAMLADNLIDELCEAIRSNHKLDAITKFDMNRRVDSRFILLYPIWTIIYVCRGGSYRVAVEGREPQVIAAMEPVFLYQRAFRFLVGMTATLATGFIFYFSWWFFFVVPHDDDDIGKAAAFALAAIVGAMVLAWRMAGKMVASVNVESISDSKGLLDRLMS